MKCSPLRSDSRDLPVRPARILDLLQHIPQHRRLRVFGRRFRDVEQAGLFALVPRSILIPGRCVEDALEVCHASFGATVLEMLSRQNGDRREPRKIHRHDSELGAGTDLLGPFQEACGGAPSAERQSDVDELYKGLGG